ncbi:hypothetical protein [Oceaniovalibus sp. ACAM 378]|jgi:hypothetical protein|nr:hypothetical protein [Oceaniovalibus sp. ACAM 378]
MQGLPRILPGLFLALALAGCAVVKLPVKAAGTVVGHTILAVTQSDFRPH